MKFTHYIKDIAMKKLLSLLWILLLLFILPSELSAANPDDSIGSVVAIRGKVTATDPEGSIRKLALKSKVYRDDTLKTEKRSRLQVMFIDNTIVSLGPNSEMIISEYQWKPDQSDGGMKTKIKEGVFRIMGGAITKVAPEKFITETPAATIGIRGSMYAGRVSDGALTVVFQGGKGIYVTNPAGTVDISIPGYGTRVEGPAEPPETPQPLTSEEITDLNNALSAPEDASDNDDSSDTTESKENTETDTDSSTDDEGSENQNPDDTPANEEKEDDSLLAANTSSTDDDGTTDDADTVIAAAPAESAAEVITNDLDNTVSTDRAASSDDFIGTMDAIADSLNTINDTLKNNSQEDLVETQVAPVVSELSNPVETVTTETVTTTEAPTTTTIIVAETTTTITTIQVTTTTDPPAPVIANFTGKYLAVQYDNDTGTNTGDAIWSGDIAPTSTDGMVEGTVTAVEDSKEIPFHFQISTYDDSGSYTGDTIGPDDRLVDLVGQDRTFTNMENLHWSDVGEFIIFYLPTSSFDSGNYKFQELGFAGIPSSTLPSNGVESYSGYALAALTETGNIDADTVPFEMEVNWYNGKILGRMDGTDSNMFFIGDVSGNALSNVQFFGDGTAGGIPTAVDGTVDFGKFYGSQHQGFGMTATGDTYAVYDQANENTWSAVGAGFRVYENPLDDPVAPTGTTLWEGFTTGLAEDMDAPSTNRRLYLSSGPSDLQFSVAKDAGTFSGTLSASDAFASGYLIVNMEVGGSNGSAFVLNDNFGAGLGDGAGTVITDGTNWGGLKTYGNYMVSMPPDSQFSEYVSWGYWEAAYVDPTSAAEYHIHQPGSLWIAGERTPVGFVQGLIDGNAFVGTYQGPAHGIEISAGGVVSELTNGATNLTIDFSQAAIADKIAGTIGFDQATFNVAGATSTSGGFTATFTDAGVQTSTVNGAYFGPNAEAIGGNFHTDLLGGERYMGIFGGNKIP